MTVACSSREDRTRLIELLQKQIRNPVTNTSLVTSSLPSVSRPPFRLLTRYFARLIKTGLLTHKQLRGILDGGEIEHKRRLTLGCAIICPLSLIETDDDLNRFRRQCRVECQLATGRPQSQRSSLQSRHLYIEKDFTLGVPFVVHCWSRSSSSCSSSSSMSTETAHSKSLWRPRTRIRRGFGSLDCLSSLSSKSPRFLSRCQSLPPPLDLCSISSKEAQPCERTENLEQRLYTSTTAGAWISNFSYDSGLADVGGVPSQSRDATGTPSEVDSSHSSPISPVYRSTLYAHWWRKAKVSTAVVLAQPPSPPFPSATGKGI